MKLRLQAGSLRLRLHADEVRELAERSRLREIIAFPASPASPSATLDIVLEISDAAEAIGVSFTESRLAVTLPTEQARTWLDTDLVTLATRLPVDSGELAVAVEKDLHRRRGRPGA